jgi:hypothetical protein
MYMYTSTLNLKNVHLNNPNNSTRKWAKDINRHSPKWNTHDRQAYEKMFRVTDHYRNAT